MRINHMTSLCSIFLRSTYISRSCSNQVRYLRMCRRTNKQDIICYSNAFRPRAINVPVRTISTQSEVSDGIQSKISVLQAKKRPSRKRSGHITEANAEDRKDSLCVVAYSTAEEYDLENLFLALQEQALYQQTAMPEDMHDVLHVSARYQVGKEPREVYFFREGSVVFWNVPETERQAVMKFLKDHETSSYDNSLIFSENEVMDYGYSDNKTRLVHGHILLNSEGTTDLEKYAFSNGMALSVKLALWEASLDRYVDSIEWITDAMRKGKDLNLSKKDVFKKTGELFSLRHLINLSSDLLDTPDFYWDRANLEPLYQKTCNHLNVTKRTRVMNEKLSHCCELMELIGAHLNDRHHIRLEWMIIILIGVEVCFEIIHILERFA